MVDVVDVVELTGEADGADAVGRGGARPVGHQRQFAEVAALGDAAHLHLGAVVAQHGDAHRPRLPKPDNKINRPTMATNPTDTPLSFQVGPVFTLTNLIIVIENRNL